MNCAKIGALIAKLRKEQNLTQMQLAQKLYISDKAVSKWERGLGCPDVSLLPHLSEVLGTDLKELLEGELLSNKADTGDLRKVLFYVCRQCGNILTSTGKSTITCCGRTIDALSVSQSTAKHTLEVEPIDDSLYVSSKHPMTKEHYISFMALVTDSTVWLHRLYPEQDAATSFPLMFRRGTLYAYSAQYGLWAQRVSL